MHGMHLCTLCADLGAGIVRLFVGSTRVTCPIWEETWERPALLISSLAPSSQLLRWLFYRLCLRLACFCGGSLHYPPAVQDTGSQKGAAAGCVHASCPSQASIQTHPGVPRGADPALRVNAAVPPASSPARPFSLGRLGYLTPHQPEDSFLLVQPYDISSPSNSHKLFLPPKMPSSAPVQNTEAGLQVITCTLSNGLESPPSSLFSVTVCLCNSSTNTLISLIW